MSHTKPFLSPAEFAEWSGLSEATVRRRIKDGTIESVQPGGFRTRVLIPVDAFQHATADDRLDGGHDDFDSSADPGELELRTENIPGPCPNWMTGA